MSLMNACRSDAETAGPHIETAGPHSETAGPHTTLSNALAGRRFWSLLLPLVLCAVMATGSSCRLTESSPIATIAGTTAVTIAGTTAATIAGTTTATFAGTTVLWPATSTETTASEDVSSIAGLSAASASQRVSIQGEVFDIERYASGNIKLTCRDDTGEITVFIPADLECDALILTTGETYQISGVIQTYREQLELVPEQADDLDRVLAATIFPAVQVISVVDGDTLHVRYDDARQEKVRIIGIDSPELARDGQPAEFYAEQARDYVTALLLDKTVYLEQDHSDTDRYGRQLRYVWLTKPDQITADAVQEQLVSSILLSQGYATFVEIGLDNKYELILRDNEKQARADRLGLWSD